MAIIEIIGKHGSIDQQLKVWQRVWMHYLVGQSIEMNNVPHHPNRLVEWTELVISVTINQKTGA